MSDQLNLLIYAAVPYAVLAVFIVGHIYRYRTSPYTWTTRSSQLLEQPWLKRGIIIFHVGLLMAFGGHVGGLVVPESVTEAAGITEDMYHTVAVVMGTVAGLLVTLGLFILAVRRVGNERVRAATLKRDYLVVAVLIAVVVTGMINTVGIQLLGDSHNYRETVSPWFRSILMLQPDPELMNEAPVSFQIHALCAMLLFAIWPFTRLVHAWSVPVTFVIRPHIIFRRRDSVAR
jgi:nitrate reductase gamma subunit